MAWTPDNQSCILVVDNLHIDYARAPTMHLVFTILNVFCIEGDFVIFILRADFVKL